MKRRDFLTKGTLAAGLVASPGLLTPILESETSTMTACIGNHTRHLLSGLIGCIARAWAEASSFRSSFRRGIANSWKSC
jgi:hypothetical protein